MVLIETCAKVNLTLEVLGRRPDGFHELATVFCAVDLCDQISLEPAGRLQVTVDREDVPSDETNLCHRAATLLAARYGMSPAVRIHIVKRIPVGGGLGGGSGNAAGVLAALARLWQVPASDDELVSLAAELGSDCAFFLRGGAAVGRGRGEELVPLPPPAGWAVIVLGPAEPVPTGPVYGALAGRFRPAAGEATDRLATALRNGEALEPRDWLVNDLQGPAREVSAAVAADEAWLCEHCRWPHLLSGSGGSWFVLAPLAEAGDVADELRAAWPGRSVWVTRPVGWGWREMPQAED